MGSLYSPMDTLQQHHANLLDGLEAIARFGWLTREQISRLLWPGSTPATREKLGQRLIAKAQDQGWILRRVIDGGGSAYVLRPAGVVHLHQSRPTVPAQSGLGLRLGNVRHRSLSNNILIDRLLEGNRVWTEYEILTRRTPSLTIADKVPDGAILQVEEDGAELQWIEVEAHNRKRGDFEALCQFIRGPLAMAMQGPYQLAEGIYLTHLHLYYADDHLGALLSYRLRAIADQEGWSDSLLYNIELYWARQTPRGRWEGLESAGNLLYPPEQWKEKRLSAAESALTKRVHQLTSEMEALKAKGCQTL